jgi:hypothetical protein
MLKKLPVLQCTKCLSLGARPGEVAALRSRSVQRRINPEPGPFAAASSWVALSYEENT